jgi:hypothetical protein
MAAATDGGAQNIPAFVALLGQHLDVTVLVDAGTHGMQRLTSMAERGLLAKPYRDDQPSHWRQERRHRGRISVGDYLKLYNTAFGMRLTVKGLAHGDRILRRIASTTGEDDFEHGKPADTLLRNRDSVLPSLSNQTLDQFEALFKRLNATAR